MKLQSYLKNDFVVTINVDYVGKALRKIKKAGEKVLVQNAIDWNAYIIDTEVNVTCVWQNTKKM